MYCCTTKILIVDRSIELRIKILKRKRVYITENNIEPKNIFLSIENEIKNICIIILKYIDEIIEFDNSSRLSSSFTDEFS